MRKYRVNVNGTAYEVEIEEITGSVPSASSAPVSASATATPSGSETISSPMPGTILAVNVAKGQTVKRGQVLMILEAMKMENEIMCPRDGTVLSLDVSKGTEVETGTRLCVIG